MKAKPKAKKQYVVGYGKPPIHSQFQPGVSGNPKGRKKVRKRVGAVFADELNRKITIVENGKRRTITMTEAFIKQSINKAVKGEAKAAQYVMQLFKEFGFFDTPAVQKTIEVSAKIPPPPHLRTAEQQKRYDTTRWQNQPDNDEAY